MRPEYDPEANAVYIKVKKGKIYRTLEVNTNFLLDVDKKGNVLGIEILRAMSEAPEIVDQVKHKKSA